MNKSRQFLCLALIAVAIISSAVSISPITFGKTGLPPEPTYSATTTSATTTYASSTASSTKLVSVSVSYTVLLGGSPAGAPTFQYTQNGTSQAPLTLQTSPQTVSMDVGSGWTISSLLPDSGQVERWAIKNDTGVVNETTSQLIFTYYHQFALVTSYGLLFGQKGLSVVGPHLYLTQFGVTNSTRTIVPTTTNKIWVDAGSNWYVDHILPGSIPGEQWQNSNATGRPITQPGSLTFLYMHQFLLAIQVDQSDGGSTTHPTDWVNANSTVRIQATPNSGYEFESWSCAPSIACSTELVNPLEVTVTEPTNVIAHFQHLVPVTIQTDGSDQSILIDNIPVNITSSPIALHWSHNSTHTLTPLSERTCGFRLGPFSLCQWRFVTWTVTNGNGNIIPTTSNQLTLRANGSYVIIGSWNQDYTNLYLVTALPAVLIALGLLFRQLRERRRSRGGPRVKPGVGRGGIRYRVGYLTDVGRVRTNNEDSLLALEVLSACESRPTSVILCAVADGVGGSQKGEIASKLTLQTLASRFSERVIRDDGKDIGDSLRSCIEASNESVVKYGMAHRESEGLASTIVSTVLADTRAYIAHVGDSRAYLVNRGEIRQLTKDHSEVQERVDAGKITQEQARHDPSRNVITRAIGASTDVQVAMSTLSLAPGDRILLCSDGLWELVTDAEIHKIVMQSPELQAACKRLVSLANERGGKDNITVVIVELPSQG